MRSPVFDEFPDLEKFWGEQKKGKRGANFQPYYHWRRGGFVGKYTNTSPEGVRLTIKNDISPNAAKIFMFGGSTLWGTGSQDGNTIPSELQALLGSGYDIYNFGETGYVSAQELNYLLYKLSMGDVPDTVIFYDGINDGYAGAYSPAVPRDPQKLREKNKISNRLWADVISLFNKSNYYRFFFEADGQKQWDMRVERNIEINSAAVIDMYEAHIKQVRGLAKEYGFKTLFFWRLSRREDEGIYFLGDLFDEIEEPIYFDWMHIGPNGNAIVAEEMFNKLAFP